MHSRELDSILAKLRPVIGDMADAFWLAAVLDPGQQKDINAVARAMAAELLGESYVGEHILLEPGRGISGRPGVPDPDSTWGHTQSP